MKTKRWDNNKFFESATKYERILKKRRTKMLNYREDFIRKQDGHIDKNRITKMIEAYE